MRKLLTIACAVACLQVSDLRAQDGVRAPAVMLIDAAITAQGGLATLESVKVIRIDSMGHDFALEQSERPDGPYLVSYQQGSEIRDHANGRVWRKSEVRNWSALNWTGGESMLADGVAAFHAGGRWRPQTTAQVEAFQRDLALAPERLLMTAKAASDLRVVEGRTLQGVPNEAVAFSYAGAPYTLYLNTYTKLPTMLSTVADDQFGIWGDVTRERWYSFWSLQPGGWYYPQQISTTWNGIADSDRTALSVGVNPAIDEAAFAIPEDTRAAFRAAPAPPIGGMQSLKLDPSKAIHVTPDVVVLPGAWAVTLVRQPDGIVVLEAPIGSAYSAQVIEAASKIFPVMGVKAVVTTSDAWPHMGGVREYVARGIPVFALDLNRPILDRLLAASYSAKPDRFARAPQPATWIEVSGKTTIGSGTTRIDLIPVRGEGAERMMVAHFPALNLLYASDLLQANRDRTGFFHLAYPAEAMTALEREDVQGIDRVWAMHMDPIPWGRVTDALAAVRAQR